MLLGLATLILAGLSTTKNERQARGRSHELRHRLGMRPALRGMARRYADVLKQYGEMPFWIVHQAIDMKVTSRLTTEEEGEGFRRLLGPADKFHPEGIEVEVPVNLPQRVELGPMIPWLAREIYRVLLKADAEDDYAWMRGRGYSAHRWAGVWARSIDEWEDIDVGSLLDWYTYSRPLLEDYTLEEADAVAKAWHRSLPIPAAKGGARNVHGEVLHRFDDGWTVQDLVTREQLAYESRRLNHCVGIPGHGYFRRMTQGKIQILSLRDEDGIPMMTWEVNLDGDGEPEYIEQAKGQENDLADAWDEEIAEHAWEYQDEHLPGMDHWSEDAWMVFMVAGSGKDIENPVERMEQLLLGMGSRVEDREGDAIASKTDDHEFGLIDELRRAWANLVNAGQISRLPGPVAGDQIYDFFATTSWDPVARTHTPKERRTAGPMWVWAEDEGEYSRNDDGDIPPLSIVAQEQIRRSDGSVLQVYVQVMLVYEAQRHAYMNGEWRAGVDVELRWKDGDGNTVLETSGFSSWDPRLPWTETSYIPFSRPGEPVRKRVEYLHAEWDQIKPFLAEAGWQQRGPNLMSLVREVENDHLVADLYEHLGGLTVDEENALAQAFPPELVLAELIETGSTAYAKAYEIRKATSPLLPIEGLDYAQLERFRGLRRRAGR